MYDAAFLQGLERGLRTALPAWGVPPDAPVRLLTISENATFLADDEQAGRRMVFRVHRPAYPAERYAQRSDPDTDAGSIYRGLRRLLQVRRETPELAGGALVGFRTHDPHVLGYQRPGPDGTVLVLVNLSEEERIVPAEALAAMTGTAHDLVTDVDVELWADVPLAPLQFRWLQV